MASNDVVIIDLIFSIALIIICLVSCIICYFCKSNNNSRIASI